jgi:hypothetical protein
MRDLLRRLHGRYWAAPLTNAYRVAGADETTLEANLTIDEASSWFASVRTGHRFRRHER